MLVHKHSRDHLVSFGRRNKKKRISKSQKIYSMLICHSKKTFYLKYQPEELETKKKSSNHESKLKLL